MRHQLMFIIIGSQNQVQVLSSLFFGVMWRTIVSEQPMPPADTLYFFHVTRSALWVLCWSSLATFKINEATKYVSNINHDTNLLIWK